MSKVEREIKILDIDVEQIKNKLQELGAKLQYDVIQKIYVYDLQPINSRFDDCLRQARKANKDYEVQIIANKLKTLFEEIDDLTDERQEKRIKQITGYKNLSDFISNVNIKDTIDILSGDAVKKIISEFGINPNKWIRLRETNGKAAITIKHILTKKKLQKNNIQTVVETEIEIPSIEKGNELLEKLGFSCRNYQEKKRIKYILTNAEIDIDYWPLIPPYLEIEGETEKIMEILKKMKLHDKKIVSCNTAQIYEKYGLNIYDYRELKFDK